MNLLGAAKKQIIRPAARRPDDTDPNNYRACVERPIVVCAGVRDEGMVPVRERLTERRA
jgi:hypothetical protein